MIASSVSDHPDTNSAYICPLTLSVMDIPMVSRWGHSFERSAILAWLKKSPYCPLTRRPMRISDLLRNRLLEKEIKEWKLANGYESEDNNNNGDDDDEERVSDILFFMPITPELEEKASRKRKLLWKRMFAYSSIASQTN